MDASKRAAEENQIIFVKRSHLPLLCLFNLLELIKLLVSSVKITLNKTLFWRRTLLKHFRPFFSFFFFENFDFLVYKMGTLARNGLKRRLAFFIESLD